MVVVMIPGLGFLYSGLARRKSALTMLWITMASFSVITFQWYLWGYSLAFSAQGTSGFIGDLKHFGLTNTLGAPSPGSPLIPELLYSFYQVNPTARPKLSRSLTRANSCNFVQPLPRLQQGLSLSVVACSHTLSSSSVGPPSSIALSPAGPGTLMAGDTNMVSKTMPAEGPWKSALACQHLHTLSSWANDKRR